MFNGSLYDPLELGISFDNNNNNKSISNVPNPTMMHVCGPKHYALNFAIHKLI